MIDYIKTLTRQKRRLAIAGLLLVLAAVLIAGCAGGSNNSNEPSALNDNQLQALAVQMAGIEKLSGAALAKYTPPTDASGDFLAGYAAEVKATRGIEIPRNEKTADEYYKALINTRNLYSPMAAYRTGVFQTQIARQAQQSGDTAAAKIYYDLAKKSFTRLSQAGDTNILVRQPAPAPVDPAQAASFNAKFAGANALNTEQLFASGDGQSVFYLNKARLVAMQQENYIYLHAGDRDTTYYRAVDAFVGFFNKISPVYGAAIALIVLSLLIKLVTAPLTTASYRGMRDMQRVQPLIKELQEKYKDDKAKVAEEQMKLMKEHKVNPLGGCLPMLIQLPVFIVVYSAVRVYSWQFSQSPFLWIDNLAAPDWPLLILYAISMIVTQKLTTPPATDPQQKAMQTQMTYLMPIMLLFILGTLQSAFVLYWFFLNVFSAAHQYYLVKKFDAMEAAAAAEKSAAIPAKPAAAPESGRKAKRGKR